MPFVLTFMSGIVDTYMYLEEEEFEVPEKGDEEKGEEEKDLELEEERELLKARPPILPPLLAASLSAGLASAYMEKFTVFNNTPSTWKLGTSCWMKTS